MAYNKKSLPRNFLSDIILTFLFAYDKQYIQGNYIIPNIIADYEVDYIVEWKDLFEIRKHIIRHLENSDDGKLIILRESLKIIFAELENKG